MSRRVVILTEGKTDPRTGKTATCMIRYKPQEVIALLDSTNAGKTSQECLGVGDVPIVSSLEEVSDVNTLMIGIAPPGGRFPDDWRRVILGAIRRGLDIVNGLHESLSEDSEFVREAKVSGAKLIDVRKTNEVGGVTMQGINGRCLRVHTVGHDCTVGKMVVALEVSRSLQAAGWDAKFVATGQTGIMVEGDGCPIDAVRADSVAGAAERLVLKNQHHDILLIEGQGSVTHPSYSGVTLGLLHGSMPHGLIFCYEVGRTTHTGMDNIPLPPLREVAKRVEMLANLMNPCKIIGIGMNTRYMDLAKVEDERRRIEDEFGVPACDVIRDGPRVLVEAVLSLRTAVIGE